MSSTIFESDLLFSEYISETHFRGLSVGYELGTFRYDSLVELIFDALPDFALNHEEKNKYGIENSIRKIRQAAKAVYSTDRYNKRGEFGEILLHIILRDLYNTIPAISKIFYEDGPNEVVKGFDAVHVVAHEEELELWLGEVKFYDDIYSAIHDVVNELLNHTTANYLRNEFAFITNKIENDWTHASKLKDLISGRRSLDKVFSAIRIPVLLTYDSKVVANFSQESLEYVQKLTKELVKNHNLFRRKQLPTTVDILLILLPLEFKATLTDKLHTKLKVWQSL